ncbi:10672_t:CDS:1 [Diversispora eburnea]|uniref:10672_t:CDS:1 n=1 Tax=Diversispora eburnea TaxID=1213867 RepID=A0A9N8Z727_9GLOM|nr:10672_t:CDS:1 [Diversispora eburnea]
MSQKSAIHYYDDGDIILMVEDMSFCVHKKYLSLASRIFNDMCATCSQSYESQLPIINLSDDSATAFEELLSFLYPSKWVRITWDNVSQFLQFSDKYEIISVLSASEDFLEQHFVEKPLKSLVLADSFRFKNVYKESSKLVINQLPSLKNSEDFKLLSIVTSLALLSRYLDYINGIGILNPSELLEGFTHEFLCNSTAHESSFIANFTNLVKKEIQVYPVLSPTRALKFLMTCEVTEGTKRCISNFEKTHLPGKLKAHFGEFEPMASEKRKYGIFNFLFIELKDN